MLIAWLRAKAMGHVRQTRVISVPCWSGWLIRKQADQTATTSAPVAAQIAMRSFMGTPPDWEAMIAPISTNDKLNWFG